MTKQANDIFRPKDAFWKQDILKQQNQNFEKILLRRDGLQLLRC